MSLFREIRIACPSCAEEVIFDAVNSVNADRRPDYRDDILASTFQQSTCEKCGETFRLDPELTYLDVGRGQWLAIHPFGHLAEWESLESQARNAFERSYGGTAPAAAKQIGKNLTPRIVFGWAAAVEKIYAAEQGIDDLALELTKMATLHSGQPAPITARTELRLVDIKDGNLVMAWIVSETGLSLEVLGVPRDLYDEIAADTSGWEELRSELEGKLFVDMQRLILAPL